ncbi:hypothetical protein C5B92_16205 [Rathayibacter sp. AY1A4]|uniref:hypothetical protein n=1 Tax=Rathayibacter sp. AY1A4 TaxID=2080522 RepID=UPI000CE8ADE8|nr:hypothetical protein [Rathayibacter sp. AY1A4]PPF13765.1 hypothetical protein C5B92_16205 [Rathayibacter sp. AY1A4]
MTSQTTTQPAAVDTDDESYREPIDVAALAAEYARLGAVAADAKERQEQIAEQLREGLEFGTHQAGNLAVAIQHNRRPNTAQIEKDYPADQFPAIYVPKLDMAAFRKYVAPIIVENYQVEGAPKVLVK